MTAPAKLIGFGTTLSVDVSNGTTFVVIGSITSPPTGPSGKTAKVNTSLLSDKVETSAGAQTDPGEITFSLTYDSANTDTTELVTLYGSSAVANWEITWPNASTTSFHAWVSALGRKTSNTENVTVEVTLQLSGSSGF